MKKSQAISIILVATLLLGSCSADYIKEYNDKRYSEKQQQTVKEQTETLVKQQSTRKPKTTAKKEIKTTKAEPISAQELASINSFVTEDRMRMLQATTQIAMERNGYPDNTSS